MLLPYARFCLVGFFRVFGLTVSVGKCLRSIDWGLPVLTATERRDLLEILEDRQGRGSTIVTSQLPIDQWNEAIGDPTLADAILDRLVHNAHRLALTGDSMRRKLGAPKPLDQNGQD